MKELVQKGRQAETQINLKPRKLGRYTQHTGLFLQKCNAFRFLKGLHQSLTKSFQKMKCVREFFHCYTEIQTHQQHFSVYKKVAQTHSLFVLTLTKTQTFKFRAPSQREKSESSKQSLNKRQNNKVEICVCVCVYLWEEETKINKNKIKREVTQKMQKYRKLIYKLIKQCFVMV